MTASATTKSLDQASLVPAVLNVPPNTPVVRSEVSFHGDVINAYLARSGMLHATTPLNIASRR